MDPKDSLPCSKQPASVHYLEPVHTLTPYFLKIHFNIIFSLISEVAFPFQVFRFSD